MTLPGGLKIEETKKEWRAIVNSSVLCEAWWSCP